MRKLTVATLISACFMTACGGGGGSDPDPQPAEALRMTPSIESLGIYAGYSYKIAQFTKGVKPYFALNSSPIVSAEIDSAGFLYVSGNRVGSDGESATVRIQDSSLSQMSIPVEVQVHGYALPSSMGGAAVLFPGEVFNTQIQGQAPFYAAISDIAVASVKIDAKGNLTIVASALSSYPGSAVVTVRDAYGNSSTIEVLVKEPQAEELIELSVYPVRLDSVTGGVANFRIVGGKPPYQVASQNILVAKPTLDGSQVVVDMIAAGSTSILISDSAGASVSLPVEVAARLIVTTPDRFAIDETDNATLTAEIAPVEHGDQPAPPYTAALARSDRDIFSATVRTSGVAGSYQYWLDLGLGTRGNRCVTEDREVEVLITDANGSITRLPIFVRNTGAC